MKEQQGNLWDFDGYKVIPTNGVVSESTGELIMGAGVALQAKKRYPHIPSILGGYVLKYGNRPFILPDEQLMTLPTKHHWKSLSDPILIQTGCRQLMTMADKYGLERIGMPRPGCGKGGLTWEFIRPWIIGILDDRFTILEVTTKCVV